MLVIVFLFNGQPEVTYLWQTVGPTVKLHNIERGILVLVADLCVLSRFLFAKTDHTPGASTFHVIVENRYFNKTLSDALIDNVKHGFQQGIVDCPHKWILMFDERSIRLFI